MLPSLDARQLFIGAYYIPVCRVFARDDCICRVGNSAGRADRCQQSDGCSPGRKILRSTIHRAETSWVHLRRGKAKLDDIFMNGEPSALELRGLTKRFDRPAVDALDLS